MRFSPIKVLARNKTYIIVTVLVIACLLLLLKFPARNNIITKTFMNENEDEVEYDESISDKNDSLAKYGFIAVENIIITDNAKVRRTPNIARYNTLYQLRFGKKVYTKSVDKEAKNKIDVDTSLLERENQNGFIAIYATEPITLSEKPVGYVAMEDMILKSEFKNYKPQPKRTEIDPTMMAAIESNLTINEINYKLIQDNRRFNNSLTFGDYNNDGYTDFAIILDTADNANSIFLIFIQNTDAVGYRVLFNTPATSFLRINTISRGTTITFSTETTSFPYDGIQVTTNDLKPFYYFYTPNSNSFTIVKDSK